MGTAIGEVAAGQLRASPVSVGSMLERKWSCWVGPFIPRRKWPEELYKEGMGAKSQPRQEITSVERECVCIIQREDQLRDCLTLH